MTVRASTLSIAVVVPAYNNPDGVRRTLAALSSRLHEHAAVDVVVVDDGSTDDTAAVATAAIASWPSGRVVSTANAGPAAARNRGAREGRGSHLVFLDLNDAPLAGWLTMFAEALRNGAGLVHCDPEFVDAAIETEHGFLLPGCFALARDVFEAVGGYDERLRFAENTDLVERAQRWCRANGRPVTHVGAALLQVHDVSDPRRYDRAKVDAMTYLLTRDADELRRDRRKRARLARVGAVSAARIGEHRTARRLAVTAARAEPLQVRNWLRVAMTVVPAAGRRRWNGA
jgi:glycosyltransferase involved in cell wall biosynthesis